MKASGVIAALVLGLLARGAAATCLSYIGVRSQANIDNIAAIIQYALIFLLAVAVVRSANRSISSVFGRSFRSRHVTMGIWYAVLLLMITFGINTVLVWGSAQISPSFAYKFWYFHASHYYIAMPALAFIPLIAAQFVCAPIVEEFIFRGLLFNAWLRYGAGVSSLLVALVFTLLHFEQHLWLSTFIFSIVLSLLYVKYNSLWINVVVHAVNNLSGFLISYYFDFYWTRPIEHLTSVRDWFPELVMLFIAGPILAIFIVRTWPRGASARTKSQPLMPGRAG